MTLVEDVHALQQQVTDMRAQTDDMRTRLTLAEVAAKEVMGLRRMATAIVLLVVAGAIGFGFSVLTFVPH